MKLTKAQEKQMTEHKKNHTAQHMKDMRAAMVKGKSFKTAHTIAKNNEKKT